MVKFITCKYSNFIFIIECSPSFLRTTLIAGIVVTSFTFSGLSELLILLVLFPYATLVNIMACRVYRRTRMGTIRESEISTTTIGCVVNAPPVAQTVMFNDNSTTTNTAVPHNNSRHDAAVQGFIVGTRKSLVWDEHYPPITYHLILIPNLYQFLPLFF